MDIGFDKDQAIIGTRRVMRLLARKQIEIVYIASNADSFVRDKIMGACFDAGVEFIDGLTKEEMGKLAGIEVNAACFGFLKK